MSKARDSDDENIRMAKEWLVRLRTEGDRTTKTITKEIFFQGEIVEVKKTVQIQRPCPNWVIDRISKTSKGR